MPPDDLQTLLFTSEGLGLAGSYDSESLARLVDKGSLLTGRIFLRATLDEMVKIRSMCRSIGDEDHHKFLHETKTQYDDLARVGKELQSLEKRKWIFKFFDRGAAKATKSSKHRFVKNAFQLWVSAAATSDALKRAFLSVATTDFAPVERESVPYEQISGVAVDLNGPVTPDAAALLQEIGASLPGENPFDDPPCLDDQGGRSSAGGQSSSTEVSPSARSSISTSLSSPGSASSVNYLNFNINYNVISTTDSDAPGITINNNSSESSGSTFEHGSSVKSPPPSS